jgi:D-threo-aldose 1-dehydrogenase
MRPTDQRRLGSTGLSLTQMGFGGAPLGSMRTVVSDAAAEATLGAAWDAGIRYYDTAPWYGRGLSEQRLGNFLKAQPRDRFVLSTKVGRVLQPASDRAPFDPAPWAGGLPFEVVFDYSYDGIMRSFEDSLHRLGLTSVDLLLIHDLDSGYHGQALEAHWAQLAASGWRALTTLKDSGAISGIGAGINGAGYVARFLEFDIDFFLLASPYTLLDQSALEVELPLCVDRRVGVIIGAVFNSGILATGVTDRAQYNYGDADRVVLDKVRRLESLCERHETSLRAAALQFPLGHPSVAAVIPGAFLPEQVIQNVEDFQREIPNAFWKDVKGEKLLAENAPTPELAVKR